MRTGLCNTDDVVSSHNSRNRVGLDWSRIFIAAELDVLNQNGVQASGLKLGRVLGFAWMDLLGLTYIDNRLDALFRLDDNLDRGQASECQQGTHSKSAGKGTHFESLSPARLMNSE